MTATGLRARLRECTGSTPSPQPRSSSATSTTSSPSPASRSAPWSRICGSRRSRSATSCRRGSAAVTLSPTRVCGTPVRMTTGRSSAAWRGSGRPRHRAGPCLGQRPHGPGLPARPHPARDRRPDGVRRARGRLPGDAPGCGPGASPGPELRAGERAQRAERRRVRGFHRRPGPLGTRRRAEPAGAHWPPGAPPPTGRTARAAYDPAFRPAPYASRVLPRPGGHHWPAMTAGQERAWSGSTGSASRPDVSPSRSRPAAPRSGPARPRRTPGSPRPPRCSPAG
ncbi:hypothetical protein SMICM17S_00408 [Streptomyces microflavus]